MSGSGGMSASTVDVLLAAADLLEVDGWQQGAFGPHNPSIKGCRCAMGAIRTAAQQLGGWPALPIVRLYNAIGWEVALWNDVPGRTADEVIGKLREVASDLFERGENA